jgi:hypothetical protein
MGVVGLQSKASNLDPLDKDFTPDINVKEI